MKEKRYFVKLNDEVLAKDLSLEIAYVLIRGITELYYGDMSTGGLISIGEMEDE